MYRRGYVKMRIQTNVNADCPQLYRNDAGLLMGLMLIAWIKQRGILHGCAPIALRSKKNVV
jgi:hypothetical protein